MADSPQSSAPPARKPLSMLWVLAAIGCFVVVHTLVNVAYRKPEPAHEPAAEARARQRMFVKGDLKGWTRIAARLAPAIVEQRTAGPAASVTRAPAPESLAAALPFELVGIFSTDPRLHDAPMGVGAPGTVASEDALRVWLRYAGNAPPAAFGEPLAFAKDRHLFLFLQDETRPAFEQPPTPFAREIELALPPSVLSTGIWKASFFTKDAVFSWEFNVAGSAAN
jgi:hypothetical protein